MAEYECPNCDGGFPENPDMECPWCGLEINGEYDDSGLEIGSIVQTDPEHIPERDFNITDATLTNDPSTTPCPECGKDMPLTTWVGPKPKCDACLRKERTVTFM